MLNRLLHIACLLLSALLIWPFADCLAESPQQPAALQALLDQAKEKAMETPMVSDSIAKSVLQQSLALKNDSLVARSYYLLGVSNYFAGKHLLAQNYYNKALNNPYTKGQPSLRAALLNNLGIIYEYQGKLGDAAESYYQSMQVARELGDSLGTYQSCINLGFIYLHLVSPEAGGKYLREALRYFRRTRDDYHQALCLHNLAVMYSEMKDFDQMGQYFQEARLLYEKAGIQDKVFEVTVDQLFLQAQAGRLEQARQLLPGLLQMKDLGNNPYVSATVAMAQGVYLTLSGANYQEAERQFLEAESGFRALKAHTKLTTLYEHFIDLYGRMGDFARQREVLEEYHRLIKEKYNSETSQKMAGMLALAELEKEEQERVRNSARQDSKRQAPWGLLAMAVAAVAAIAFYKYSVRPPETIAGQHDQPLSQRPAFVDADVLRPTNSQQEAVVSAEEVESSSSNLFEKVTSRINGKKRYLDPHLKITDIAFELGTNEKYISQAISQGAKAKFVDYIAGLRVNEAKRLLAESGNSSLSIKEIAMKSGFGNQPQFQRKFKEITGMTPVAFREACDKAAKGA
ncbi:MAG: hypothetical protein RI973_356 [Bacteroidota bacterium]|jgi:AraC-like DNA-binding protein